jgi:hypothetical protein
MKNTRRTRKVKKLSTITVLIVLLSLTSCTPRTPSLFDAQKSITLPQLEQEEAMTKAALETRAALLNADVIAFEKKSKAAREDLDAQATRNTAIVQALEGALAVAAGQPFTASTAIGLLLQAAGSVSIFLQAKNKIGKSKVPKLAAHPLDDTKSKTG